MRTNTEYYEGPPEQIVAYINQLEALGWRVLSMSHDTKRQTAIVVFGSGK